MNLLWKSPRFKAIYALSEPAGEEEANTIDLKVLRESILLHLCNTSVDILKIKLIVRICYYWEIFAGHSFYDPRWCGREDSGAHFLKSLRKINSVQKFIAGYQSANQEYRIIEKTNIEENVVFATLYDFLWMFFNPYLTKTHSQSCSYCAIHRNLPVFSCLGCEPCFQSML